MYESTHGKVAQLALAKNVYDNYYLYCMKIPENYYQSLDTFSIIVRHTIPYV